MDGDRAGFRGLDRSTALGLLAAAVFLLVYGFREIFGTDIGTLLALGRDVAERGGVPREEPLTWTQRGQPFLNSWWLYSLGAWTAYRVGGTLLLSALSLAVVVVALWIALERVRLRHGTIPAIAPLAVIAFALSETFEVRPHMVSWALLGVVLFVIERDRARPTRHLLWLPLVFAVWANTHSFWVLGLGGLGAYVVTCVFESPLRARAVVVLAFAGSIAACLATPYFVEGLTAPFRDYRIMSSPLFSSPSVGVAELRPLLSVETIRQGEHLVLFQPQAFRILYFCAAIAGIALVGRRLRAFDILVSAAFAYLALSATRNFALFFFVTLPVVLHGWELARERASLAWLGRKRIQAAALAFSVVLIPLAGTGRLFAWQWQPYRIGHAFSHSFLPVDAATLLNEAGATGSVVNAVGDGGFIALSTRLPTYIDGRLFGEASYQAYLDSKSPEGIARVVAQARPGVALVRHDATLAWLSYFSRQPDWRLVYADAFRSLYVRRDVAVALPELHEGTYGRPAPTPFTPDDVRTLLQREATEAKRSALEAAWQGANGYPVDAIRASTVHLTLGAYRTAAGTARDALLETGFRVPELYYNLGFALVAMGHGRDAMAALTLYLEDGRDPILVEAARTQVAVLRRS